MKEWIIDINVVSTAYEAAHAFVKAETLEEAIELFEKDPYNYEWEEWEMIDADTQSWEVNKETSKEFIRMPKLKIMEEGR